MPQRLRRPAVYFAKTLNAFPTLRVVWYLHSGLLVKTHDLVRTLLSVSYREMTRVLDEATERRIENKNTFSAGFKLILPDKQLLC